MLSIRRSLRFHSAARMLPHATNLLPSSAITWMSFSSSSLLLEALTVSSRSFSQISSQELLDATKEQQKRRFFGPKKSKKPIQDAAKQSENLTRLQANPDDADLALEVFAAIQSANGSGLSMDVAPMLMSTFINNNKLDKALQVLEFSNKQKVSLRLSPYEKLMAAYYKTKNYDTALKVFEMLRSVKLTPSNMMYTTALLSAHKSKQSELMPKILEQMLKGAKPNESRAFQVALSAAVNSRQHELVLTLMECLKAFDVVLTSEHYHFVLKSYATVGDVQAALGTRDTLQKNGFDLTEYGMRWLVHCACKVDQWDLVKELLSAPIADNEEGVVATVNAFNAALAAYGNKERWDKVVDVYDIMPENLRSELKGWHLGVVVMGHAKSENKKLQARALEIFNEHKEKANDFAYGAAITALLETEKFDAALALAEDMKAKEIAWSKSVYQAVALALVRRGTTEEAVQLLEKSVLRMGNGPEGYLDIIQFYTDRHLQHDSKET